MSLSLTGQSVLVVFDLDGTLIDSSREIAEATNLTRQEYSLPAATAEELKTWFGMHPRNFFLELNDSHLPSAIASFRKKIFDSTSDVVLFPDALQTLKKLRALGCTIGVATTKSTELATRVLNRTPLSGLIDETQGTDRIPEKPNPAVFQLLEEKLRQRLDTNKTWFKTAVGDRASDIEAGNAAGYQSYGVLRENGSDSKTAFIEAGAFGVLTSLSELPMIRDLENMQ